MGVNPVGNVQKYFTFDGETSKTYNTHITGRGVFNAPLRNVEMVTIPNRNGAFALDKGNFENIELVYEASVVADSVAEFSQAVSDLRNWLCSKVGYCRLEDDYNTGEYRMAVYKSGLEVEPFLATSGQFEIIFDCKPQRFLTSGETAVAVANNGTITNPTLFGSSPLLEVEGYGTIGIGSEEIEVQNVVYGSIQIANAYTSPSLSGSNTLSFSRSFDSDNLNNGDAITGSGKTVSISMKHSMPTSFSSVSITSTSGCSASKAFSNNEMTISISVDDFAFAYGTSLQIDYTVDFTFAFKNGTTQSATITGYTKYTSGTSRIYHYVTVTNLNYLSYTIGTTIPEIYANSTVTATGHPLYIDLELGEAWNEDGGSPVSLNNAVQIPAELPKLPSGATTITYDNTITDFKIVPRWWKV